MQAGMVTRRSRAYACRVYVKVRHDTLYRYDVPIAGGTVSAEGDLDFRGTLGVAKDAPVGFKDIRLRFDLETDAPPDQLAKVVELTERYCVVYQTLCRPPRVAVTHHAPGAGAP